MFLASIPRYNKKEMRQYKIMSNLVSQYNNNNNNKNKPWDLMV
jgi:hypothetical protein